MGAPGGGSGWADLGFCALALGFPEEAEQHFQRGLTQPSNNMYTMRPRLLSGAALAALALDKIEDARRYALEARTYTEEHSMKAFYPLVYLVDGHVKQTLGDCDAALASYERAEQLALEMGMRPVLWQARAAAARTLDGLGRHEEASDNLNEARAVIDDIAAKFKDEDYRQMFLDSATNRLVMSKA
jgi:tetratricopeptide (TPR) repeat protein